MTQTFTFGTGLRVEVGYSGPALAWTAVIHATVHLHCRRGEDHEIPIVLHQPVNSFHASTDPALLRHFERAIRGDRAGAADLAHLLLERAAARGIPDPCIKETL